MLAVLQTPGKAGLGQVRANCGLRRRFRFEI
jgi:hypothetical protein